MPRLPAYIGLQVDPTRTRFDIPAGVEVGLAAEEIVHVVVVVIRVDAAIGKEYEGIDPPRLLESSDHGVVLDQLDDVHVGWQITSFHPTI